MKIFLNFLIIFFGEIVPLSAQTVDNAINNQTNNILQNPSNINHLNNLTSPQQEDLTFHPALPVIQTGSHTKQIVYTILAIIAIILALYFFIKYIKNRKKIQKVYTPLEVLLQNFHIAKQKMANEDSKEFAEILSTSVRDFINSKYRLPSTTKTSEEFLKYFKHSKIFHHDIYFQFVEFFSVIDDVKFAGRVLRQSEQQQIFIKACRLLIEFRRNFQKFKPKSTAKIITKNNFKNK